LRTICFLLGVFQGKNGRYHVESLFEQGVFMKVIIFGATGTIGQAVSNELEAQVEIIRVGKTRGDYQADIRDSGSIQSVFKKVGPVDAIVVATGDVAFAPLESLEDEHWEVGIQSKFLGQVRVARIGMSYLNEGGSITLTSGVLSDQYIAAGTSASAINRAVEGFVQAASQELKGDRRINVISPGMLAESEAVYGAFFPGHIAVPGSTVAKSYAKSVFGIETGRIYRVD